jgi:phosphate transport system substrate-binding protein
VTSLLNRRYRALEIVVVATIAPLFPSQGNAQSTELPPYASRQQVTGVIRTWGSPQMGDLLKRYEEGFRKVQPSVHFEDTLKSTVSAVAGVYADRADIGLLGREIWPSEVQAFESVKGHAPATIEVATGAYDIPKATYALMIFVHRSNPMKGLSLEQLDRIFGYAAGRKPVHTWGDLGLKGIWAKRKIHLYGFSTENDKALIFSRIVFHEGTRWNCDLREYSNASGPPVVDAGELILRDLAKDPVGIGISNIHYATQDVKVMPLSTVDNESYVAPTRDNIASRRYPLSRAVYIVFDPNAGHFVNPIILEFLRYILSSQGQEDVLHDGTYLPLTPGIVEEQRRLLDARLLRILPLL